MHVGALNDLNIWERNNLHQSFIDGSMTELDFEFKINGEKFTKLFFFGDGINLSLSRFVKTIFVPLTNTERKFAKWQESVQKNVES